MLTGSRPIFLSNANYYGTLAAVRSLGRAGIKVETADPARICHGRYSRYASQHHVCPPFEETEAWSNWLMRVGGTGPRRAIFATSDAVSFALASHRDQLSEAFDHCQPSLETIMSILDKGELHRHAEAVGIDMPETWFPRSSDEAVQIARDVGGDVLIKPRSQLAQLRKAKGTIVSGRNGAIAELFDSYASDAAVDTAFARLKPDAMLPFIQRFYSQAKETVYSLTGFREPWNGRCVMRGAQKILQCPRPIGVGLCFEPAPVDPVLANLATKLCERIGYHGVFELEFIIVDEKAFLIDFNGRLYNQIALDIARSMDLPAMAYAAAVGDQAELLRLMQASEAANDSQVVGFCNRFSLATMIKVQRLAGRMSSEEAKRWQTWIDKPSDTIIDAVSHPDDTLPRYFDIAHQTLRAVRHPRSAIMQFASIG